MNCKRDHANGLPKWTELKVIGVEVNQRTDTLGCCFLDPCE